MPEEEVDLLEHLQDLNKTNDVDEQSDVVVGARDDIFSILLKDTSSKEEYDKSEYPELERIRERLKRKKMEREIEEKAKISAQVEDDTISKPAKLPKKDVLDMIKESAVKDDYTSSKVYEEPEIVAEQPDELQKDVFPFTREAAAREDYTSRREEVMAKHKKPKKRFKSTLVSLKKGAQEKIKKIKRKPKEATGNEELLKKQQELLSEIEEAKEQLTESNEFLTLITEEFEKRSDK